MNIDQTIVEQFRDAAWDAYPIPDDSDKRLQYIVQLAADHALEEAEKEFERWGDRDGDHAVRTIQRLRMETK